MRMDHRWRIARLGSRQVLIGVQGEMVGAKCMPQAVGFASHLRFCAQVAELLLVGNFMENPKFAGFELSEFFQPSCQGRADLDKAACAGLAFAGGDFDMVRDAPYVGPVEPKEFSRPEASKPANCD